MSPRSRLLPLVATGVAVLALGAAQAAAGIERYAILVGNNRGDPDEEELRYAETDAAKLADALEEVGGFAPENLILLRGKSASAVRRSLIALNDRIRTRSGGRTILFVYYSGHADAKKLHLGGSHLELAELEQLVRGSAAGFRLLVLDACRSGALTRVKGGASRPPVRVALEDRLAGEGVVFLTASSASEDAQESDELAGSFFTHYLVSGLLGAADQDGEVVLREAYRHAYDSTIEASSRTLAGIQHPTFRYELRGQGDIVLARPGSAAGRATLRFPPGRTYLVLRPGSSGPGPVVAEVGAHDRSRRVSVKPGRYFVRGRGATYLVEGTVTAPAGAEVAVTDGALERFEYARLVRKGSSRVRGVHGLALGYSVGQAIVADASPCHGPVGGHAFEGARFTVSSRVSLCRARFRNETLDGTVDAVELQLGLVHAWDLPQLTVHLGIAAGGGLVRETFETRGRAPARLVAAGHLGIVAGLVQDLPHGVYIAADLVARTSFFALRQDDGNDRLTGRFGLQANALLGWRFR